MRLLFLNQFYPPDTAATAQLLGDLAEGLAGDGHEVHIVCGAATYRGSPDLVPATDTPVQVHRVGPRRFPSHPGKRLLSYARFYRAAARVLRSLPPPDLVVALTTPPYIGRLAAGLAREQGIPWICWHMDAYPEVLSRVAGWSTCSPLYRYLARSSRHLLGSADRVVVLGSCMQRLLVAQYGLAPSSCPIIPNWAPGDAVTAEPWSQSNELLYAGNLGRGHDLGTLLDALARLPSDQRPPVRFSGRGHQRPKLEARCRAEAWDQVRFTDPVPLAELSSLLGSAPVHFISQRPGTQGILVPSKLYGSLAAGRAVLFQGPADTEAAHTLRASGAGWVLPPGEVQGLADQLTHLQAHPEEARAAGEAALAYHQAHGGMARGLARWREVITEVASDHASCRPSATLGPMTQ